MDTIITFQQRILDRMDALQPEQQSSIQPTPQLGGQPQKRWNRRLLIGGVLGLVAAAIIASGSLWLAHRQTAAPHTTTRSSASQTPGQVAPDTVTDTGTAQYVSNGKDLKLSFSYPSSWSVMPPSGDNANDQTITITSPLMSVASTSDQSITARAIVLIRPGGSDISELASEKATAGQASAQIAYSKPTAIQHQYPYLTYIHLNGGTNPSGNFEEVMVTGITTFAKDQSILPISLGQLDPIVSAAFYQCTSQACSGSGASPLSLTNTTWQSSDLGKQVLQLFESLQLN